MAKQTHVLDFSKCKSKDDVAKVLHDNRHFFKTIANARMMAEGGEVLKCECGECQCTLYNGAKGNVIANCSACGKTMFRGKVAVR